MRIIALASQKGGSGKTTIAAHLAVQAGKGGEGPAVLVDTDPQGSLGEWWRERKNDTPALATVKLDDLDANLAELRSYGTAVAFIDTPPALTSSIERVIATADLCSFRRARARMICAPLPPQSSWRRRQGSRSCSSSTERRRARILRPKL